MWVFPLKLFVSNIKKFRIAIYVCLAILILLLQLVASLSKRIQQDYIQILELAQRQKLISQQMVKHALNTDRSQTNLDQELHQMAVLKHEWSQLHFNPKFGNQYLKVDPHVKDDLHALILNIQPHYEGISDAVNELLMVAHVHELRAEVIDNLMKHERPFLLLMDEIISAYRLKMREQLYMLDWIRISLTGIILLGIFILVYIYYHEQFSYKLHLFRPFSKEKEFFNEQLAEEYLMKHENPDAHTHDIEETQQNQGNLIQMDHRDQARSKTFIARVLIIYHENIPIDYLAWFLNRYNIDFSIVHSIQLALDEVSSNTFDIILISESEIPHKDNLHSNIPVVSLNTEDIEEIHALIVVDSITEADTCQLFHKINSYLPKDKLSV